jgi:Ribbon-helix-helix protein, copG family
MEKTTLYLDAAAYRRLKRIAAARKRAPAALVREAVAEYVARHGSSRLPPSVGAFGSGRRDLAERAEDLLAGFGERRRPDARRGRR